MKRFSDIVIVMILLALFFFPMLILALIIRWKLGSPVFFFQVRSGLKGAPFKIIKFRTMLDIVNAEGNLLSDESRLTTFGRFLRSTSLDELPELWNVLKGDMSLVGPRPLLMEYLPLYNDEQQHRHDVRPGITGWAQVNGRNAVSWEEKFKLDLWYVNNQSFFLDAKILFLTVKKVIFRENIYAEGRVTVDKFTGN